MGTVYLLLTLIGTVLPYSQFLPWFREHGFNVARFFGDLFSNRIGGFFAMDVFVSYAVLVAFVWNEGTRARVRSVWLPLAVGALVGVSAGLPLFLYLRERARVN